MSDVSPRALRFRTDTPLSVETTSDKERTHAVPSPARTESLPPEEDGRHEGIPHLRRSTRATRGLIGESYEDKGSSPFHMDEYELKMVHIVDAPYETAYAVTTDPRSMKEAMRGHLKAEWLEAAEIEFSALQGMGTWDLEPVDLPEGRSAMPSMWVFKTKLDQNGDLIKRKGRLVALGCYQRAGIDFQETFAPTMRTSTLRMIIAIANFHEFELHQSDVSNAYLHADLEEVIYLRQPEGFDDGTKRVLLLRKPLYGLRQSAARWGDLLCATITESGHDQSENDPCLFTVTHKETRELVLAVATHVDDMVQAGKRENIRRFQEALDAKFKVIHEGEMKWILGMEVVRDLDKGTIGMVQGKYCKEILEKFEMTQCNPKNTPLPGSFKLNRKDEGDQEPSEMPYREVVGSVMYLSTCTRPDLAYAMGVLTQRFGCPTAETWNASKMVLKYLKGTCEMGISYDKSHNQLVAYVDSDWAGDKETRRSTTGYVIMFCGGPVSWRSGLQKSPAGSSAEAEYVALGELVKEVVYLRRVASELGCEQVGPTEVFVDNDAAIKIANNGYSARRLRHIEISWHISRHAIKEGKARLTKIASAENPADILTKALAFPAFSKHRDFIMGGSKRVGGPPQEGVEVAVNPPPPAA